MIWRIIGSCEISSHKLCINAKITQLKLKLMNIRAAIDSLEDVKMFLEYHGLMHESSKVHSCIDSLALVALPGKQSDIRSYFRPV